MQQTETKRERAILAGLSASSMDEHERSSDISMDELSALVETAGGEFALGIRPASGRKGGASGSSRA